MKKILLIFLLTISSAFAELRSVDYIKLNEAIKEGIVVIDIRRSDEWSEYGIIQGSHKLTFFDNEGKYDVNKWLKEFSKLVKSKEQAFVLVCAHANRSKSLGKMLSDSLHYKNVYELEGGINYGWLDKGLNTIK